jgi:multiple sugar transport system permease protein
MSTYAYNILFSGLELGYGSMIATAMFVTEVLIAAVFGVFIIRRMRQEA